MHRDSLATRLLATDRGGRRYRPEGSFSQSASAGTCAYRGQTRIAAGCGPGRQHHSGQGTADPTHARLPARPRPLADRGSARCRQDDAGPCVGRFTRTALSAHPVHQRPAAGRHHRGVHLRPPERQLPLPPRPDLRPDDSGRRGQPRHSQGPERAAGGDGGAPGHHRRRDASFARAVLCHRNAEPLLPGRYLPVARVPAGPLPDVSASWAIRSRVPNACCWKAAIGAT